MLRQAFFSLASTHPNLHRNLYPWVMLFRSLALDAARMPRQLLQVDFLRWLLCFPRYLFLFVLLRRYKVAAELNRGVSLNTLRHNMRGSGELAAPRSHLLIRPVVTIDWVSRNMRKMRVLTIGPRVEGEIYNLIGYGFSGKNIRGLDLFSYSPYIDVGNMHDMQYPDSSFDIVFSGWVLGYSDDKQKCADEMIRVCKPGGIIAIGNGYYELTDEDVITQGGLKIGSSDKVTDVAFIERLFKPTPGSIYFRYDGAQDRVSGSPLLLIYRVDK